MHRCLIKIYKKRNSAPEPSPSVLAESFLIPFVFVVMHTLLPMGPGSEDCWMPTNRSKTCRTHVIRCTFPSDLSVYFVYSRAKNAESAAEANVCGVSSSSITGAAGAVYIRQPFQFATPTQIW